MAQVVTSLPMQDKDWFILHIQYHSWGWPGSLRRQDIRRQGIDPVLKEEFTW